MVRKAAANAGVECSAVTVTATVALFMPTVGNKNDPINAHFPTLQLGAIGIDHIHYVS